MSNGNPGSGQGGGHGGRTEFVYSVDGKQYHVETSTITGAQIKAKIPNFNPTLQLFLEGKGGAPDRLIADSETVDLAGGEPHLYTAPPATFGTV